MGEYIEREAAKRALADSDVVPKYKADNRPVTDKIIDDIPAADVAPVVHGRWMESGPLLECQSCGEIYSRLGGNAGKLWNYCPNCGAKMDGGVDDEM